MYAPLDRSQKMGGMRSAVAHGDRCRIHGNSDNARVAWIHRMDIQSAPYRRTPCRAAPLIVPAPARATPATLAAEVTETVEEGNIHAKAAPALHFRKVRMRGDPVEAHLPHP